MRCLAGLVIFCFIFSAAVASGKEPPRDGVHKTYYATGELRYESQYKNGKLNGLTREYKKDGTLKVEFIFADDEVVRRIDQEKARDFGPFNALVSPWFWGVFGVVLLAGWLLFGKIFFRDRPF